MVAGMDQLLRGSLPWPTAIVWNHWVAAGNYCVQALAPPGDIPRAVSQHLKILREAGLVREKSEAIRPIIRWKGKW